MSVRNRLLGFGAGVYVVVLGLAAVAHGQGQDTGGMCVPDSVPGERSDVSS